MKVITREPIPLGRLQEFRPPHPERTAYRNSHRWDGGYTFAEWPSRGALLTTIRMQERRAPQQTDWKAYQK